MEMTKNVNVDNIYSDSLERIKLLYSEFKNSKAIVYEYYRRLHLDITNSTFGKVRKELIEIIDNAKSGIVDLKTEIVKYFKKNKNLVTKYSFESAFSFVKKIDYIKNQNAKTLLPSINKVIVRLTNLEFADKNKFKKLINKFYFILNNYIKILVPSDKSDFLMGWVLGKVNPQN
jgi:hypothetical protein